MGKDQIKESCREAGGTPIDTGDEVTCKFDPNVDISTCLEPKGIEGEPEPAGIECSGTEWENSTARGIAQFLAGKNASKEKVKRIAKNVKEAITEQDVEDWEHSTIEGLRERFGAK